MQEVLRESVQKPLLLAKRSTEILTSEAQRPELLSLDRLERYRRRFSRTAASRRKDETRSPVTSQSLKTMARPFSNPICF